MERAVDGEVGVVGDERLFLLARFAGDDRRAQDDVAEQGKHHAFGQFGRETQDVGRVVAPAVMAVEGAPFLGADDADGEVGFADAALERGADPFAETHRRGQAEAGQGVFDRHIETNGALGHGVPAPVALSSVSRAS
jgi:hypothetical protein